MISNREIAMLYLEIKLFFLFYLILFFKSYCEKSIILTNIKNYLKYFLGFKNLQKNNLELKKINIRSIITKCTNILSPQALDKSIVFMLEIDENLPKLNVDITKIKQIFLSLLTRSIKYSSPNQTISITTTKHIENGNSFIAVTIQDKGFGLSEEMIDNLETKLNIKRDDGEMRLSEIKDLMELHNGMFTVSSFPGKGTSITLLFPVTAVIDLCIDDGLFCRTDSPTINLHDGVLCADELLRSMVPSNQITDFLPPKELDCPITTDSENTVLKNPMIPEFLSETNPEFMRQVSDSRTSDSLDGKKKLIDQKISITINQKITITINLLNSTIFFESSSIILSSKRKSCKITRKIKRVNLKLQNG